MTDGNISELRDAIRELTNSIQRLNETNRDIDRKLCSLELKIGGLWLDFWRPALAGLPLLLILAVVIKHL